MGDIKLGKMPVSARQTSVGAMTGVIPIGPDPDNFVYLPDLFTNGRFDYVDPADHALKILKNGGIFRFTDIAVIPEIRSFVPGGTLTVIISDRDGSKQAVIENAVGGDGTRYSYEPPINVLVSQQLIIKTSAAGSVDVYLRKGYSY